MQRCILDLRRLLPSGKAQQVYVALSRLTSMDGLYFFGQPCANSHNLPFPQDVVREASRLKALARATAAAWSNLVPSALRPDQLAAPPDLPEW